jgi:choline dehydrogenase-like flavoprotein
VSATGAEADAQRALAQRLGFASGQVVLELGYDDDCDEELRAAIGAAIGTDMVDEDFQDIADLVVLWWREDDGDLVDALVDSISSIASGGVVWLLTPKAGRDGHVEPSDIGEAAPTAGLSSTKSTSAAKDWSGTRLVAPRLGR